MLDFFEIGAATIYQKKKLLSHWKKGKYETNSIEVSKMVIQILYQNFLNISIQLCFNDVGSS